MSLLLFSVDSRDQANAFCLVTSSSTYFLHKVAIIAYCQNLFQSVKGAVYFLLLIVQRALLFCSLLRVNSKKEIVRCKRLSRWSVIFLSSDRFLPRALILLLRSLHAYFYRLFTVFFTVFLPYFYRPFYRHLILFI